MFALSYSCLELGWNKEICLRLKASCRVDRVKDGLKRCIDLDIPRTIVVLYFIFTAWTHSFFAKVFSSSLDMDPHQIGNTVNFSVVGRYLVMG